jgi:alpha-L-fucosidase
MKARFVALLCVAFCGSLLADEPARSPSPELLVPTAPERDGRLGWWRDARFGMFVHWGVYSTLGGTWKGQAFKGYGEHIQRALKIPIADYRKEVAGSFNPTGFDAEAWIRLAKKAGMGYFIITAKHHDGFAMFDSKVNDYNVVKATPFAKDPMLALREACRKRGLKFGFYYSHAFDWGEANAPGNDWDYDNPGGDKLLHGRSWWKEDKEFLAKARTYVDGKAIPQLLELIRTYHPDIIWFDTPHKLPPEETLRILAAVRKADPNLVVNGRVVADVPALKLSDYLNTADRPAEFPPQEGDWEGIPTTNESYSYNQNDHSHKPVGFFIRLLAKAAARGGNVLLNIGPRGDGLIDPADAGILEGIGAWWKVNGESIRGTTRTPLPVQAWGESTRKGNRLYLHVFRWPDDGKLVIGGLKTPVAKAALLAHPDKPLAVEGNTLTVPETAPDAVDSVIALECAGEPQADPHRLLVTNSGKDTLRALDAQLEGHLKYGSGTAREPWVHNWKGMDDVLVWPVRADRKLTYDMELVYDAPEGTKARLTEGDAGKEKIAAQSGAGGTYELSCGDWSVQKTVRTGTNVVESLGRMTVNPGEEQIRIRAVNLTGEELFKVRALELTPVTAP